MKKTWNLLGGKKRLFGKRSRPGNSISKRFSSAGLEHLETRALLSATAWYSSGNVDAHATPLHALSVRSMLSSCDPTTPASNAPTTTPVATTYSVQNVSAQDSSAAAVVADSPVIDAGITASPAIAVNPQDATDKVGFRLEAEDASNNPITSISVGQTYQLAVFVDDIRTPPPAIAGVFGAFLNVGYSTAFSSIASNATATFGPSFSQGGSVTNATTAGTLNAGSFGTSLAAPGGAEQLLFRITVTATAAGTQTFTSSFDSAAGHDTLLYGLNDAIAQADLLFGSTNLTILANTTPTVALSNVTQLEGTNALSDTLFVFTATLSSATGQTVTVKYATADGTATTANNDYIAASGTLTFAPGVTTQLLTVSVKGDAINEADELFNVNLSAPTNATLAAVSAGVGTILNDDPVPTVSVSTVQANEGNAGQTPFMFTVSLSNASNQQITVPFNTTDGTATTADNDYAVTSGTLTFAAGDTAKLVTVQVNGDTVNEGNETFSVTLGTPTNATLSTAAGQGVGTILNDDGPRLSFSPANIAFPETDSGQDAFIFTVTTTVPDAVNPITVAYTTQDGTATVAGNDYAAKSGTLTFAPGVTSQNITVFVKGDTVNEADETFKVVLSNPTNATITQTTSTATILNDDAPPALSFVNSEVQAAEGNTGSSNMLFTAQLSAVSGQTVTVLFATVDGTATTANSDYTVTSGTLTFAPGATTAIITVPIVGDLINEANETFTVKLINSTNASNAIGTGTPVTATGTIQNDDAVPTLSIGNQQGFEGNSGTSNIVFTATLSAVSGQTVTAAFATSDGSASVADNDYVATNGTLTFAPGQTTALVTVVVNGDTRNESSETFKVDLSAPSNVTLATSTGVGTIVNDDAAPSLSVNSVSKAEGNTGTTDFVFTVTLSAVSGQTVTVNYATAPGTAATGTDFVGQSGVLTFAAGVTQQLVTVAVNGDTLNEADETFTLNLSSGFNATIAAATGTGTIQNDDALPTLSIGNFSHLEGDSGNTPFVFVVNLSTLSGQTVTVAYATADGTATTANNDYVATSGTLTFGAGVTTQNLTVQVVGDLFLEPNETFVVKLSGAANATIQTAQGTGTILTEATDTVSFTPSSLSGFAFIDSNTPHDLLKGAAEPILGGVIVSLTGTSSVSNAAVTKSTTTDASTGAYTFAGLDPGSYTIKFTPLANFKGSTAIVGSQGGTLLTGGPIGFNLTIPALGGVTGINNNYAVRAKLDKLVSLRDLLASHVNVSTTSLVASPAGAAANDAATITQNGHTITVLGMAGDDVFEYSASSHSFKINGVTHQFDPANVSEVDFDGAGGSNVATLTGSSGNDVATVGLGSGSLSGTNFKVSVSNAGTLSVHGGGGQDTATLQDSVRSDALSAVADEVVLTNDLGLATSLAGFVQVKARSTSGGSDTAHVGAIDFALEQEGAWVAN